MGFEMGSKLHQGDAGLVKRPLRKEKKLARSNTIEDTAVIFAVSRVFIIDFPLRHNGWAIMKSLSFLFFCVGR